MKQARCRRAGPFSSQQASRPFRAAVCTVHSTATSHKRSSSVMRANSYRDDQQSQQQQVLSRRQSLASIGVLLGMAPSVAHAVSTDLVEGTQNWFSLGVQSYSLWAQSLVEEITNDDQTGIVQQEPKRTRFGSVNVPGLSSFSFIHGTLVGGTLILLLSLIGANKDQQQQSQPVAQPQQQPDAADQAPLRPEVESALRRLLSAPETSSTFHDPAVHAALQDVRGDLRNINKYRDDPVVMQAFQKLLEIEDILEHL